MQMNDAPLPPEKPFPLALSFVLIVALGLVLLACFAIGSGTNQNARIATAIFFGGAIVMYFAPSIIALLRSHKNQGSICVLNLLLGWTVLGWIGALVWAFSASNAAQLVINAEPATPAPIIGNTDLRACPFCAEPIRKAAIKCKHCGSEVVAV